MIDDKFTEKLKNEELESEKIIPICLELYKIMDEIIDPLPKSINKRPGFNNKYFVPVKFSADKIKISYANTDNMNNQTQLSLNYNITNPTIINSICKFSNLSHEITLKEYNEAFNETITKTDMMGISKKILHSLPDYMKQRILKCYNKIYTTNDINLINEMNFGKATYIYKIAKKGNKEDINSYRKILSIPTIINHLHRILNIRLCEYIIKNNYIDTTIQKGGISGLNAPVLQQYYKCKNVVKHAIKNKLPCCLLFLDVSDAFGSIDRNVMYEILKKYHVSDTFINYIKSYYDNFEYYVKTKEWNVDDIKWNKQFGVIQGCPLSATLFILTLNYILKYLNNSYLEEHGYTISTKNLKILLSAYIDDLCIITNKISDLEIVFARLKELLLEFGFKLNTNKSGLIILNQDTKLDENSILKDIPQVTYYKYLGEYISADGTNKDSFNNFIKVLSAQLFKLDTKKVLTNENKIQIFEIHILPMVHRKLTMLFDLSNKSKLKIITLITEFITKWNGKNAYQILPNTDTLFENCNDVYIGAFENNEVDETENDEITSENNSMLDIEKYILNNNIVLHYGDINNMDDDFNIDNFLKELDKK